MFWELKVFVWNYKYSIIGWLELSKTVPVL